MGREQRRRQERQGKKQQLRTNKPTGRQAVFRRVKSAVVGIGTFQPGLKGKADVSIVGSGVCMDPRGVVLTVDHVVRDAMKLRNGSPPDVFFLEYAGDQLNLTKVAIGALMQNAKDDLAIIRLKDAGRPLPFVPVDPDCECWEGEELAVCGFPFGLDLHKGQTITSSFLRAMISAVLPSPVAPREARRRFQLDAMINPGNSGGPLFRPQSGAVVGIVIETVGQEFGLPADGGPDTEKKKPEKIRIPSGLAVATPAWLATDSISEILRRESS